MFPSMVIRSIILLPDSSLPYLQRILESIESYLASFLMHPVHIQRKLRYSLEQMLREDECARGGQPLKSGDTPIFFNLCARESYRPDRYSQVNPLLVLI